MDGITMTTKLPILVTFANAVDSKGDDGKPIVGCTVNYFFLGEDNDGMNTRSEWDISKPVGQQRGKSWSDYDLREKIPLAPAVYEGTFSMKVGSDGKPVLTLIDVAYICNVMMVLKENPGLVVPGMLNPPSNAADTLDEKGKK